MSRLVFFNEELQGNVNSSLGLVKKLVERGEEVIYYSSEKMREKIEDTGAQFRKYKDLESIELRDGDGIETLFVFADHIIQNSKKVVDSLLDEIKELRPDYIIHDTFCYWGREFGRLLEIPAISVFAIYAYNDEVANIDPEFFMENILRAGEDPFYKRNRGNPDIFKKIMDKLSKMILLKHGVKCDSVINEVFCSKERLNVIFSSRMFQRYPEAFDSSYLFAGYSIYPRKERGDFPFEMLDGRPLIYIAFGTMLSGLEGLYKNCFKAFGGTDYQVVLSVGNQFRLENLSGIPENFIVRSFVPQLELLKRADLFINHAGTNSVYESICFEVPMVVIPQAFDEFLGAGMVESSGAGVYLRSIEPSASELKEAALKVLADKNYKDSCTKIKKSFEETGGLEYTVDEIFKYTGRLQA